MSLRIARAFLAPAAVLLLVPASSHAQSPAPTPATGAVLGFVVDSLAQPVPDAEVLVVGTTLLARVTPGGAFRLEGVPAGVAIVRVRKLGYRPQSIVLEVADGGTTVRDVILTRLPTMLQRVLVQESNGEVRSANLARFHERARGDVGRYLRPEQIARQRPTRVSDLFRMMPGVRVSEVGGRAIVTSSRGDASVTGCGSLPIFVNDVRMAEFYLDDLIADEIAAVEVYAGVASLPPTLAGADGLCGAIVIWTK